MRTSLGLVAVIALATPPLAAAQGTNASDSAKPQVQTFEMVLRTAVETGGQRFARQAAEVRPDIAELSFATGESPVVSGIADHQLGLYVFQVQVPSVSLTLHVMNLMMMSQPPLARSGGRVSADGLPVADRIDPAPSVARPDFVGIYRSAIRDALVDAIVDNAGGLPLTATDTLLVYAGGIEPGAQPSLLRQPTNKLVLKVKGADLLEFRQNRIDRDEMKRRVGMASF